MTFSLSPEQVEKFNEWKAKRQPNKYSGASGGRWTWKFTPTSLGCIVKVTDGMLDKETLDLTYYDEW